MDIDVYHSGRGRAPRPPFAFVRAGVVRLPSHPGGDKIQWTYWKRSPLETIAVVPSQAETSIWAKGYFIQ